MTDPENPTNQNPNSPRDRKQHVIGAWLPLIVLSLAALAFAWFVWPTRYRYDRLNLPNGSSWPLRMDRFSGKTEAFVLPYGWSEIGAQPHSETAKQEDQTLPQDDFQRLSGTANVFPTSSQLSIRLYNGSDWNVNEITVDLLIPNKERGEIRRWYRIKKTLPAEPLQTTLFQTDLDSWPAEGQKWGWNIVEAKVTKQ